MVIQGIFWRNFKTIWGRGCSSLTYRYPQENREDLRLSIVEESYHLFSGFTGHTIEERALFRFSEINILGNEADAIILQDVPNDGPAPIELQDHVSSSDEPRPGPSGIVIPTINQDPVIREDTESDDESNDSGNDEDFIVDESETSSSDSSEGEPEDDAKVEWPSNIFKRMCESLGSIDDNV